MTAFASVRLDINADWHLYLDGNGKVTRGQGDYAHPIANAFSLVQVQDCPFATEYCKASCYVHGLEKNAPEIHALYRHNSEAIRAILEGGPTPEREGPTLRQLAALKLARYINQNCKSFRWHISGDIFSYDYAIFIAWVVRLSPDCEHWIYTRSFRFVEPLAGIPNLVVNLSADRDNWHQALNCHYKYGFRLCYMADGGLLPWLPDGSVIFPDYPARGREWDEPTDHPFWKGLLERERKMICPADFFGQSESLRCGPCKKCLV